MLKREPGVAMVRGSIWCLLDYPDVNEGLKGMVFMDAVVISAAINGALDPVGVHYPSGWERSS